MDRVGQDERPSLSCLALHGRAASTGGPTADEPHDPKNTFYTSRAFVDTSKAPGYNPDAELLIDSLNDQWDLRVADTGPEHRLYHVNGDPVWWSAPLDTKFRTFDGKPAHYKFLKSVSTGIRVGAPQSFHTYDWPATAVAPQGAFEIATPYPVHVKWAYLYPSWSNGFMVTKHDWPISEGNEEKHEKYKMLMNKTGPDVRANETAESFRAVYCAVMAIDFIGADQRIRVCGQMLYTAEGDTRHYDLGRKDPDAHSDALTEMLRRCPYYDLGKQVGGALPGTRGYVEHRRESEKILSQFRDT